ncbi:MAG TPA: uracil-DNA glycosylase family protein [Bacteroidales bacterium]|nr:uracil-DNA glycosylase family protein [Bacteroidales bacterium]
MNPFKDYEDVLSISSSFYRKYYKDHRRRHLILGINPGRFGGGLTGVPFTDPKHLVANCGLEYAGSSAHEPSSVFVYEVIKAFGGEDEFYGKFYIHSICPLGLTLLQSNGKEVNCNYYDSKELQASLFDFIVDNLRTQVSFDVYTDVCFCLGTGKNERFLKELNKQFAFFEKIISLEHPRYIMQYKSKQKEAYIQKYVDAFTSVL